MAIILVSRRMGYAVQAVSVGAGNWFGAAGYRAGRSARSGDYLRADVVLFGSRSRGGSGTRYTPGLVHAPVRQNVTL